MKFLFQSFFSGGNLRDFDIFLSGDEKRVENGESRVENGKVFFKSQWKASLGKGEKGMTAFGLDF